MLQSTFFKSLNRSRWPRKPVLLHSAQCLLAATALSTAPSLARKEGQGRKGRTWPETWTPSGKGQNSKETGSLS